jgi:hypothetical protein
MFAAEEEHSARSHLVEKPAAAPVLPAAVLLVQEAHQECPVYDQAPHRLVVAMAEHRPVQLVVPLAAVCCLMPALEASCLAQS